MPRRPPAPRVDVGPAARGWVADAMLAMRPHFVATAEAALAVLGRAKPGSPAPDPVVLSTAVRLAAAVMALGLEGDAEAAATLNAILRIATPIEERRTLALDCFRQHARAYAATPDDAVVANLARQLPSFDPRFADLDRSALRDALARCQDDAGPGQRHGPARCFATLMHAANALVRADGDAWASVDDAKAALDTAAKDTNRRLARNARRAKSGPS